MCANALDAAYLKLNHTSSNQEIQFETITSPAFGIQFSFTAPLLEASIEHQRQAMGEAEYTCPRFRFTISTLIQYTPTSNNEKRASMTVTTYDNALYKGAIGD